MKPEQTQLEQIQHIVLDMLAVERNHRIPGSERRENVVEHSFSVAMLCWRVFDIVQPPLDLGTILKYALIHDFSERGRPSDVNTYAGKSEREAKKTYEALEIEKIASEFGDFEDFVRLMKKYEEASDEESLFVWSVDKMQSILLGGIDKWRPYALFGVTYERFVEKGDEFLGRCSPYVKGILKRLLEESKKTYYDQP